MKARGVPSFWCFGDVQGMGWNGRATTGTGRAKLLAPQAQKNFFVFLNLARTISYETT